MAETIRFRFTNDKKQYVESLVPLSYTNNFAAALVKETDTDSIDYDWIKDNILNSVEQILTLGGISSIFIWAFDKADGDFFEYDLVFNPGSKSFVINCSRDPLYKGAHELFDAAETVYTNLVDEIQDILIRSVSSKSVSAAMATASSGSADPKCSTPKKDLDQLCRDISQYTKAEIVKPKETLADYVCNDLLKEELEEIKDFFENSMSYRSCNVNIPKGVLFKGPPGTGKTYAARCIAGSVECYFMVCTASALQGQYVGSGAENIRMVFKAASDLSKESGKGVILFIDEIDSLGDRKHRSGGAGGEEDRTLNQLLAELSGFTEEDNIMVIAATNYAERLDDALMRSGRFGRQITIDYPDDEQRRHMVEFYFNKITLPLVGTDSTEIADLTKGLTPADIKEIANESGILTIRQKLSNITLDNVNEAINKVITKNIRHPDPEAEELKLVTAHECGHVLAEVLYNNTTPIKVTNYAYGDAGGFTQSADPLLGIVSKDRYLNEIKVLLGGRAAELVICGYITTGASSDLKKAKELLKNYYAYYNFETYTVDKLEQTVVNELNDVLNSLCEDFRVHSDVLNKLIDELSKNRVLYAKDIFPLVAPLRKVVL